MENKEQSYLLIVRYADRVEHLTTISGKNAKHRAQQYAKQIIVPDRNTVEVILESEFYEKETC